MRAPRHLAAALLIAVAVALSLWDLASSPPPSWDEGWSMQTARNLLERGHYGRLSNGAPTNASLVHGFVVVIPMALSLRLFGVGFWQARLVTVVYFALASALLYVLTRRLFGNRAALLALFLSIFLSPLPSAGALLLGRQVLGEMPMLAFLTAALLLVDRGLAGSTTRLLAAALCLTLAVVAKHQLAPFLVAGFAATIALALYDRRVRVALLLLAMLFLALSVDEALRRWGAVFLPGYEKERFDTWSLFQVTVMVLDARVRAGAVGRALLFGLPSIAAIAYGALALPRRPAEAGRYSAALMLSLCAAWLAWFVALSAGWPRYLFPPLYLATPFVAALFCEQVKQLRGGGRSRASASPVRRFAVFALAAQVLLVGSWSLARFALTPADDSAVEITRRLNRDTPAAARIETYESELTFLLDRPYHSPPVQTHVEMIRNHQRGDTQSTVAYDALEADPDYLVVGPFSYTARLYEPFIEAGDFRFSARVGPYDLYERVRR